MSKSRTERSAATREDIVAACLNLFAYQGFHITTIDDIAKNAGITKGAIYWHFKNKGALFEAILDKIRHDWQETVVLGIREEADPRLKVEKLFENYFVLLKKQPEICLFLQRVMLRGSEDKYVQLVNEVFEGTAEFIAGILKQGKREKRFKSDVEAKLVAHAIIASLAGATSHCYAKKSLSLKALIEQIKQQTLSRILVED